MGVLNYWPIIKKIIVIDFGGHNVAELIDIQYIDIKALVDHNWKIMTLEQKVKCMFYLKKVDLFRIPCSCSRLGNSMLTVRCVPSSFFSSYLRKKKMVLLFIHQLQFPCWQITPVSFALNTITEKILCFWDWWQIALRHIARSYLLIFISGWCIHSKYSVNLICTPHVGFFYYGIVSIS